MRCRTAPRVKRGSRHRGRHRPGRAAANGKDVAIAGGGTLLGQVIELGLLDELELHVAPVILGDGMRLLSPELGLRGRESTELTPARVIATPDVTHIRYKVEGRRPLAAA